MQRRKVLQQMAALPLLAACQRSLSQTVTPGPALGARPQQPGNQPEPEGKSMQTSNQNKNMPVLFLAHGAPILLDDPTWIRELSQWGQRLGKPKAILMISAHWDATPVAIGATTPVPLVYDFYGFPQKYYQTQYAAPGSEALAQQVRDLLKTHGFSYVDQPSRGLDHGAYVPLVAMYPAADVPVLQISLPGTIPGKVVAMGQALASLRAQGVLIIGSGFITHNMHLAFVKGVPAWAREFDQWTAETLQHKDLDSLTDFMIKGPGARMALPTTEHFVPLLLAAGAVQAADSVSFPITGFWNDMAFTRRSVQFG